jgi:HAMP domain-containing protein
MHSDLRPNFFQRLADWLYSLIMSVPVHVKIAGLVLLPVIVLGVSLNYWVASGLKDWLSYLLTDVRVDAAMRAGQRSVQLVTILGAAGSLLVAYLLTFILTRPLLALREMAQKIAAGDLTARTRVWSKDEIGQLATAVNTMTDHLVDSQEELARSNRHLGAINRMILAANRPAEIHDVLYSILGIVVDVMRLETVGSICATRSATVFTSPHGMACPMPYKPNCCTSQMIHCAAASNPLPKDDCSPGPTSALVCAFRGSTRQRRPATSPFPWRRLSNNLA